MNELNKCAEIDEEMEARADIIRKYGDWKKMNSSGITNSISISIGELERRGIKIYTGKKGKW